MSSYYKSTPAGFEPARGDPIGLAGRRLNHSAKVSSARCGISDVFDETCGNVALWIFPACQSMEGNVLRLGAASLAGCGSPTWAPLMTPRHAIITWPLGQKSIYHQLGTVWGASFGVASSSISCSIPGLSCVCPLAMPATLPCRCCFAAAVGSHQYDLQAYPETSPQRDMGT
jgi:hypothetical protein